MCFLRISVSLLTLSTCSSALSSFSFKALKCSFSWDQTLLRRTEHFGIFKTCFIFPSTCQKHEGIPFLSNIHCEDLIKLLEVKLSKVWVPLEFLTLRVVHTESPSQFTITVIHWLQFSFSYPSTGSHGGFSSLGFCFIMLWFPEYACLSFQFVLWLHSSKMM